MLRYRIDDPAAPWAFDTEFVRGAPDTLGFTDMAICPGCGREHIRMRSRRGKMHIIEFELMEERRERWERRRAQRSEEPIFVLSLVLEERDAACGQEPADQRARPKKLPGSTLVRWN